MYVLSSSSRNYIMYKLWKPMRWRWFGPLLKPSSSHGGELFLFCFSLPCKRNGTSCIRGGPPPDHRATSFLFQTDHFILTMDHTWINYFFPQRYRNSTTVCCCHNNVPSITSHLTIRWWQKMFTNKGDNDIKKYVQASPDVLKLIFSFYKLLLCKNRDVLIHPVKYNEIYTLVNIYSCFFHPSSLLETNLYSPSDSYGGGAYIVSLHY